MAETLRVASAGDGDPPADTDDSLLGAVSHALLVVFLAFFAAYALVLVLGNVLVALGAFDPRSIVGRAVLAVIQFVGFGVGVWAYFTMTDRWELLRLRLPTLRDAGWIVGGIVVIFAAAAAVNAVLQSVGVTSATNEVIAVGQRNPTYFLYMIPVTVFLVGPFEELVFRVGAQGVLRRTLQRWPAILLASAMFGVAHWVALTGGGSRFSYILVAGLLGVVLGYAYERTGNLVVNATIHGLYNAVLFGLQYAVAVGMLK